MLGSSRDEISYSSENFQYFINHAFRVFHFYYHFTHRNVNYEKVCHLLHLGVISFSSGATDSFFVALCIILLTSSLSTTTIGSLPH